MSFRLVTDGTCDLSHAVALERDIPVIPFKVSVGNEDFRPYNGDPGLKNTFSIGEFYARMRAQENTHTSQINPEDYIRYFTPMLEAGEDVLYLAFSSGLSGTCQSAYMAKEELSARYPDRKIYVVDSLAASMGEGLLAYYASKMQLEGKTIDEVYQWLQDNKLHLCHWFTVDDLNHLKRGGRVSSAAALFGTMLGIKPVLHVDDAGHLIPVAKIRGRRQSLDSLVAHMEQTVTNPGEQVIFISHGDCEKDAQYVADQIRAKWNVKEIVLNEIGPVIGTHSGPGTVALFFLGSKR